MNVYFMDNFFWWAYFKDYSFEDRDNDILVDKHGKILDTVTRKMKGRCVFDHLNIHINLCSEVIIDTGQKLSGDIWSFWKYGQRFICTFNIVCSFEKGRDLLECIYVACELLRYQRKISDSNRTENRLYTWLMIQINNFRGWQEQLFSVMTFIKIWPLNIC